MRLRARPFQVYWLTMKQHPRLARGLAEAARVRDHRLSMQQSRVEHAHARLES